MPITRKRTREEIRQSVGLALGVVDQSGGAIEHQPSETAPSAGVLHDESLAFGAQDEHRGKWVWATDSNSSNEMRRVLGSSPDAREITVSVPFSRASDTGWRYELWEGDFPPSLIHDFINQAIAEASQKGSVPVTDESIHTGGALRGWGLSSAYVKVQDVRWREKYVGEKLVSFDDAPSSMTANVTIATDSEDKREGSAAAKLTIAAGLASATEFAESSFAATNLSGYTRSELWLKTTVTTTSSNYRLRLYEGSTLRETINLPALTADSWTYTPLTLANPELDGAITRAVLMTGASDGGAMVLSLDDLKAVRDNTEDWRQLPFRFWELDRDARELRLRPEANVPYSLLRVRALRFPNLLTTDSAECEVDSQYVINSVVAKALRARADRRTQNRDAAYQQADRYEALAQAQLLRMGSIGTARSLSD